MINIIFKKEKEKSDGVTRFLEKKLNPISWSSMSMIKKKKDLLPVLLGMLKK